MDRDLLIPSRAGWVPREPPLSPSAALYAGLAAQRLLERWRRAPPETPTRGLVVRRPEPQLLLLGPAEQLPWTDGARFFAEAPEAPGVWLPCRSRPPFATALLGRALEGSAGAGPLLIDPEDRGTVIPLREAGTLDLGRLQDILREEE